MSLRKIDQIMKPLNYIRMSFRLFLKTNRPGSDESRAGTARAGVANDSLPSALTPTARGSELFRVHV